MPTAKPSTILDKMTSQHVEKFWSNVDIRSEEECWEWLGHKDKKGYGVMSIGGREDQHKLFTHRIAKTITDKKDLPSDKILMHFCDNPPCCNPGHLVLGTHQENATDKVNKDRSVTNFGHAKNDWEIIDDIRSSTLSGTKLAEKHSLARSTISEIRSNKIWKDEHRNNVNIPMDINEYKLDTENDSIVLSI